MSTERSNRSVVRHGTRTAALLAVIAVIATLFSTTAGATTAPTLANCTPSPTNAVVNGSFEAPPTTAVGYRFIANGTGTSWTPGPATAAKKIVEIWANSFQKVVPTDGRQLAEVNAHNGSTEISQVVTLPAGTHRWSYDHRARTISKTVGAADVARLNVTDAAGRSLVSHTATSTKLAWASYSGVFTLAAPTTVTIRFTGVKTASANATIGNLIDNVAVRTCLVEQLAAPPAPQVNAPAGSSGQLNVTWPDTTGATSYKLYRDGTLVYTGTNPSYVDNGLTPGRSYSYKFTYTKNGTESPLSPPGTGIPLAAAPTDVAVTATGTSYTATWGAVSSAASYTVEIEQAGPPEYTTAPVASTGTATDTTLSADPGVTAVRYRVRVAAIAGGVTGNWSDWSAWSNYTTPNTPEGLAAVPAGYTSADLTWTEAADAAVDTYTVLTGTSTDVAAAVPTSSSATHATVTDLTPGTVHYFWVAAKNRAGTSPTAGPVEHLTVPAAPERPAATVSSTSLTLTWPTVPGIVDGYRVYRDGDTTPIYEGVDATFTDTGLAASTEYTYRIAAYNATGESPLSPAATTLTLPAAPDAPNVAAVNGDGTRLIVTWDGPTGATYKVYRDGDTTPVYEGPELRFVDTGLTPGTEYSYTVSVTLDGNESPVSDPGTGITAPATPANLTISLAGTAWATNHDAVNGTTGYTVQVERESGSFADGVTGYTTTDTALTDDPGAYSATFRARVRAYVTGADGQVYSAWSEWTEWTTYTTPRAPSSLRLDVTGDDTALLHWNQSGAAASVDTFTVYHSTTDDFSTATVVGTTPTGVEELAVDGLVPDVRHYYWVTATNSSGTSAPSRSASVVTSVTEPAVPATPTIVNTGKTGVTATWEPAALATSYRVELRSNDGTVTRLSVNTPTALRDLGVFSDRYDVRVASARTVLGVTKLSAYSEWSTQSGWTAPRNPATLRGTLAGTGVDLTWTHPVPESVDTYTVHFGTSADFTEATVAGTSPTTGYSATNLPTGATSYFWVTAENAAGTSSRIGPFSIQTAPAQPAAPAAVLDGFDATITWTDVPGATSYRLYRSDVTTPVYEGTANNFLNAMVPENSTVTYRVEAVNAAGTSPLSDPSNPITTAALPPSIRNVTSVDMGINHTCALIGDGTVKCWGGNGYGRLGDGTQTTRTAPVTVLGITNAVELAAAGDHTCARLADGTVKCWGRNTNAQLGDGTTSHRSTPVTVTGLTNVVDIATSHTGSCAVIDDGTVKCWGAQLETGRTSSPGIAAPIAGVTGATSVDGGATGMCAIVTGSTVKCWGNNASGQLGNGTKTTNTTTYTAPVTVTGIANVTSIAVGETHTCAMVNGGGQYCWGANSSNQLGLTTTTASSLVPVPSAMVPGATKVVTGRGFSCSLFADGTVKCYGVNNFGQQGNNTATNFVPRSEAAALPVVGVTGAVDISAGQNHACATTSLGIKCWGFNGTGQVGDGTTLNRFVAAWVIA